tara:strand:+ start:623 stop:1372 length:750 start_codon:yes stop_codon:yes gene_type:complete
MNDFKLNKYFLDYKRRLILSVQSHPNYSTTENKHNLLNPDEKLAIGISDFKVRLIELVSDLKKILVFIRRFPNREYYEENDINQLNYIKYHFEVFVHKIHTILEVKKLTINHIYDLGLKERDCHWNKMKASVEKENSNLHEIIEDYHTTFKDLIKARHLNTHRAIFKDSKNEDLSSILDLYNGFEKLGVDIGEEFKMMMPKPLLDYKIKKYKQERIEYLEGAIKNVEYYHEKFSREILLDFYSRTKNAT